MRYALGANRNPIRDLPHFEASAVPLPPKVTIDISMIPVLDQGCQPACVGHAFATALMYDYYRKTGKVPAISPRFIYSQAKLIDGDPDGEGTSAYFAFNGVQKAGGAATVLTVPNEVNLPVSQYKTVVITDSITNECREYPIKTEVEITNPTDAQLQTLIAQYGVVIVAGDVDEETWMQQDGKNTLLPGDAGEHEFTLFGYDTTVPGTWYPVRNSWNTSWAYGGNGSLLYSNYQGRIYDAMVITIDMENQITPTTNTVTITRTVDTDTLETKGTLTCGSFTCDTLERGWDGNAPEVSCIPKGTYQCVWSFQGDLNEYHYELQNVPGRTGIFIHEGNFYTDSSGCILLGQSYADINGDGQLDVLSSRATLATFEALFNKQPITLIIQ